MGSNNSTTTEHYSDDECRETRTKYKDENGLPREKISGVIYAKKDTTVVGDNKKVVDDKSDGNVVVKGDNNVVIKGKGNTVI